MYGIRTHDLLNHNQTFSPTELTTPYLAEAKGIEPPNLLQSPIFKTGSSSIRTTSVCCGKEGNRTLMVCSSNKCLDQLGYLSISFTNIQFFFVPPTRIELAIEPYESFVINRFTMAAFMLSRQVSNLKSSAPKTDVLPIPPQDSGDEPTDLCTVRPPLNYSLTQGAGRLIIKTPP